MTKCPICHVEMQEGLIKYDGRNPLIWVKKDKERSLLSILTHKDCIVLGKSEFLSSTGVQSSYCEKCRKIIIDVENT